MRPGSSLSSLAEIKSNDLDGGGGVLRTLPLDSASLADEKPGLRAYVDTLPAPDTLGANAPHALP